MRSGLWLVVGAAVLWGLLGIFGAYAQRAGLSPVDVAWWRAAVGAVMFAVHARVIGARWPRGRDLWVTVAFGVVSGAVFYTAYQVAVAEGGAGLASVLLYTAPAFVAVLGVPVLGERLRPLEGAAVAVSIAGVALIALAGGGGVAVTPLALGAGVLSGFTYSLYYLYGRSFYRRYHPSACLAVALMVAAVALLPLTSEAVWSRAGSPAAWPALVGVGVASTYLAYLLHSTGLMRVPATRAAVVSTIEPVVAAVFAAWLFGERPGPWGLVGGGLVVAASVALGVSAAPEEDVAGILEV